MASVYIVGLFSPTLSHEPELDVYCIITVKAGGEEDSLSRAFEKEMSLWTICVDGGPPPKKKRAIGKGELLLSDSPFYCRFFCFNDQYLVATITVIIPFDPVSSTGQALSLSKGAVVVRQAHHERLDYPAFL